MDATIRRIWWGVGIVAASALLASVVLVAQARRDAQVAPPVVAAAPSRVALRPSIDANRTSATVVAPTSPAARASAPRGARVVEICGTDPVRLSSAAGDDDNEQQLDEAVARSPVPWTDMQASADERIRAAGYALAGRIEPLAKLASQTREASVFAMAQAACARVAGDPSLAQPADQAWCETLDAQKRVALEPDNAAAWLLLAADAEAKQDAVAVDDALRRAAVAPSLAHHSMAAVTQVERYAATSRASSALLWMHRALDDAGMHEPLLPVAICTERAAPNRREACTQIAQRLMEQPSSIGDLALGLAIGRQVGIDEALIARKRDELDAVQAAETARLEAWSGPDRYACVALAGKRDWLRKQQAQGEWRSARDAAIAKAGSIEALVRRHREGANPPQPREAEKR